MIGAMEQSLAGVSRETRGKLEAFAALLAKWNRSVNLVANAAPGEIWARHVLDSAQLLDLVPRSTRILADLGAGAGFPGLVIAILGEISHPDLSVTLVEADARKCAFLEAAIRATGVRATALCGRIEAIPALNAEVLTARALAPLDTLLHYASRHLAPGGKALFLKGARHPGEIEAARRDWRFSLVVHPSRTDSSGAILEVGEIGRA
jgi:16S rRNA (guanine527-N7)-methyltransferase